MPTCWISRPRSATSGEWPGGVEVWTRGRLIGGRGGISVSTIGDHREAYSGGVSVAVHRGFYGEAQLTGGSDSLRQGWNLGFRMTF
jgi:hypothetical protein